MGFGIFMLLYVLFSIGYIVGYIIGYIIGYKLILNKVTNEKQLRKKYDELDHLLDFDYNDWGETL